MKVNLYALGVFAMLVACTEKESKPSEETSAGFDIAALDTTVSACSDFYQFTSGSWIKNNPIPETENRWGRFSQLAEDNKERIKGILEEYSGKDGLVKGSDEQLIGDLFYSGMDSTGVEEEGTEALNPYMERIDAASSKSELLALWADYGMHNVSSPFGIGVQADMMNSTVNALYMGAGGLGMPDRDYYLNTDSVSLDIQEKYKSHLSKIFVIYGMDEALATEQALKIYNIEHELAKIHMSRVERRNVSARYNPMSFEDLKALSPNIDLDAYFGFYNLEFDQIIVSDPKYMKGLDQIITTTSLEDLKAYTKWHTLDAAVLFLPYEYERQNFEFFSKTLGGKKKMQPRWKRAQSALGGLSEQLGHLYVKKYFPEESKARVEQMVEDLRSAYRIRIQGLAWMSDTTKQKALDKLNAFTYKIGYPNKWKDYSDLDITRDSYLANMINISTYLSKENLKKLGKPVDKDEWGMGAHIVNAYYNPLNNEVVFPAGILQFPFFDPNADDAINYGAIGGVIGHEFSHGFDDQGSRFGPDGNMTNWWTNGDRTRFTELTKSLSEQYSAYEAIPGVFVNGDLTLGENIADLGGITLAYYAYKIHMEGKDPEPSADGFTPEQRIFLGWAQVWQSHATDEQVRNQVTTNPHSPAKFRVIGPMSNLKEFKEAWGCTEADEMVRSEPIVIW